MKPLISVIVPVYNTDRHDLIACLESVRTQSYKNTEVVIVDDGSMSETAQFLDTYIEGLADWQVVHQKNKGLNLARKAGFTVSSGEYVTFVDSDDMLREDAVEVLYNALERYSVELAIGEMSEFSGNEKPAVWGNPNGPFKKVEHDTLEIVNNQLILNGYNSKLRIYEGAVWGKLYARALVEKVDWGFCDYKITEDEFFTVQINIHAKGVAFIHEQLYFYRISQTGSLGQKVKQNALQGESFPYIRIARDVYEKFSKILSDHDVAYDPDDLLRMYTHVLLDRTRKIVRAGLVDGDNKEEYQRQAAVFLPLIRNSRTISNEWKLLTELAFTDMSVFVAVDEMLRGIKEQIEQKKNELGQVSRQVISEEPGIKQSLRHLKHAVHRKVRKK